MQRLNECFYVKPDDKQTLEFELPDLGVFKASFYCVMGGVFYFGMYGAVSSTGFMSNYFYHEDLYGYESPLDVAKELAKQLYEQNGGKEYKRKNQEKKIREAQLSLF